MVSNFRLHDLSCEELSALKAYKTAEGSSSLSPCFDLNRFLEAGHWSDELPTDLAKVAHALDQVFNRCPRLTAPLTIWRGDGHRLRFRDIMSVGTHFRTFGFWSTSLYRSGGERFLKPAWKNGAGVLFRIDLPAGFPVYNMETLEGAGGSEGELLLPRGVMWEVIDTRILQRETDLDKFTWKGFDTLAEVGLKPTSVLSRPLA